MNWSRKNYYELYTNIPQIFGGEWDKFRQNPISQNLEMCFHLS